MIILQQFTRGSESCWSVGGKGAPTPGFWWTRMAVILPAGIGSLGAGFSLALDRIYSTTTAAASQPEEDGGVDKSRAQARLVLFRAAYLSTHDGRAGSRPVRTAWRGELRSISP